MEDPKPSREQVREVAASPDAPPSTENPKKSRVRTLLNLGFIALTLGVVVVIALTDNQGNIFEAVGRLRPEYVGLAFACIVVFWLLDACVLNYTARVVYKRESFGYAFRLGLIGQLYSALTPSATGGQPVQMIVMKQRGMPFGVSSSILVVKFIAFQSAVCLMFLLAVVFQSEVFFSMVGAQLALMILGFVVNFAALLVAILAMYRNQWLTRVFKGVLHFLHRIHIIKNLEKAQTSALRGLEEYRQSMSAIRKMRRRIFIVLLITLAQMCAYQSVVYFLYRAAGLWELGYPVLLAMQVLLFTMVAYAPLPGASGASEGGFMWLYGGIMGNMAFPVMLVWRGITFYAQILVGACALLWHNVALRRDAKHSQGQGPER